MVILIAFVTIAFFVGAGIILIINKIETPEKEIHCEYVYDCSYRFCNDKKGLKCGFDNRNKTDEND